MFGVREVSFHSSISLLNLYISKRIDKEKNSKDLFDNENKLYSIT